VQLPFVSVVPPSVCGVSVVVSVSGFGLQAGDQTNPARSKATNNARNNIPVSSEALLGSRRPNRLLEGLIGANQQLFFFLSYDRVAQNEPLLTITNEIAD
jgi:hypothetical protein